MRKSIRYRVLPLILLSMLLTACHLGADTITTTQVTTSPIYTEQQLSELENLLATHQVNQAKYLLPQINKAALPPADQPRLTLATARIYLLENQPRSALSTLEEVQGSNELPAALQAELLDIKASAQIQTGDNMGSVKSRIAREAWLTNSKQLQQNEQETWNILTSLDTRTLSAQSTNDDPILKGWIELALINKLYPNESPEKQDAELAWQMQHPTHPAQPLLFNQPRESSQSFVEIGHSPNSAPAYGTTTIPTTPATIIPLSSGMHGKKVALLLPTTGALAASANAVQAGLQTAYEEQQATDGEPLTFTTYDTKNDKNVIEAYQNAITAGSEFIIGPLSKTGVQELQTVASPNVPIVALNYTNGVNSSPVYQFGLAPEDEIQQVIKQARKEGHISNAIILASDNSWGNRLTNVFANQWQAAGGHLLGTLHYPTDGDLTTTIKTLVTRYQLAQPASDTIIFLIANVAQARQIKPLLNYNLADAVPVYATSSVYTGTNNPTGDRDLDGIIFCDTPWTIAPNHRLQNIKETLSMRYPQAPVSSLRLYALGIDSYDLINKLSHLQQNAYHGATGQLFIDNQQRIARTLPCARFVEGQPQLVNANL